MPFIPDKPVKKSGFIPDSNQAPETGALEHLARTGREAFSGASMGISNRAIPVGVGLVKNLMGEEGERSVMLPEDTSLTAKVFGPNVAQLAREDKEAQDRWASENAGKAMAGNIAGALTPGSLTGKVTGAAMKGASRFIPEGTGFFTKVLSGAGRGGAVGGGLGYAQQAATNAMDTALGEDESKQTSAANTGLAGLILGAGAGGLAPLVEQGLFQAGRLVGQFKDEGAAELYRKNPEAVKSFYEKAYGKNKERSFVRNLALEEIEKAKESIKPGIDKLVLERGQQLQGKPGVTLPIESIRKTGIPEVDAEIARLSSRQVKPTSQVKVEAVEDIFPDYVKQTQRKALQTPQEAKTVYSRLAPQEAPKEDMLAKFLGKTDEALEATSRPKTGHYGSKITQKGYPKSYVNKPVEMPVEPDFGKMPASQTDADLLMRKYSIDANKPMPEWERTKWAGYEAPVKPSEVGEFTNWKAVGPRYKEPVPSIQDIELPLESINLTAPELQSLIKKTQESTKFSSFGALPGDIAAKGKAKELGTNLSNVLEGIAPDVADTNEKISQAMRLLGKLDKSTKGTPSKLVRSQSADVEALRNDVEDLVKSLGGSSELSQLSDKLAAAQAFRKTGSFMSEAIKPIGRFGLRTSQKLEEIDPVIGQILLKTGLGLKSR